MKAVVIRHVAFEDLGRFAPVLRERGYAVAYLDAGVDPLAEDARRADLLVVLGGPIGVYETAAYPFLAEEIQLIARRLASGAPLLGVCLGAQLIAAAAGSRVYPGPAKEIGYAPVTLTDEGRRSCVSHLAAAGLHVLHWHGDTFDLPSGAARLASTALTPNQAFSMGRNVLGLQFHMEADPGAIEQWLIGHAAELAAARIDVPALRGAAARQGAAVADAGARAFAAWLDGLEISC